jgi:hypothetical protein
MAKSATNSDRGFATAPPSPTKTELSELSSDYHSAPSAFGDDNDVFEEPAQYMTETYSTGDLSVTPRASSSVFQHQLEYETPTRGFMLRTAPVQSIENEYENKHADRLSIRELDTEAIDEDPTPDDEIDSQRNHPISKPAKPQGGATRAPSRSNVGFLAGPDTKAADQATCQRANLGANNHYRRRPRGLHRSPAFDDLAGCVDPSSEGRRHRSRTYTAFLDNYTRSANAWTYANFYDV